MIATMAKVVRRIKQIENSDFQKAEVRFDRDVAKLLGMTPQSLANFRAKGGVPHRKIVEYGLKNNVSINELLSK